MQTASKRENNDPRERRNWVKDFFMYVFKKCKRKKSGKRWTKYVLKTSGDIHIILDFSEAFNTHFLLTLAPNNNKNGYNPRPKN